MKLLLIPGQDIKIRLNTTAVIPSRAATADCPNRRPFSSTTTTPSCNSLLVVTTISHLNLNLVIDNYDESPD